MQCEAAQLPFHPFEPDNLLTICPEYTFFIVARPKHFGPPTT
jgi:hypothetical protein